MLSILSILPMSTLPVAFAETPFDQDNFSANIGITSNYLFRGVTLSDDEGAVSGGFDWQYMGVYLGTWASSIDPARDETFEIDYYGGYNNEINGLAYSLDFIYYDYPGDSSGLAYVEYGGSLAYTFSSEMEPTLGVYIMHSPDFYAETGNATAIEASLGLNFLHEIGLSFHYGQQDLDNDENPVDDYSYYGVTLTKALGKFEITAGYSDTDSDGETFNAADDSTSTFFFSLGASI